MKKILLAAVVAVGIAILAILTHPVEKQQEDVKKQTYRVCYEEVNLRSEPSEKSQIVGQLTLGQSVQLSGKSVLYPLCEFNGLWYETQDGYWITGEAILKDIDYESRFR